MNPPTFAVDFFDNTIWNRKLNNARENKNIFYQKIFGDCITHQKKSFCKFVFTLRQWKTLVDNIDSEDIQNVKKGIQDSVTIIKEKIYGRKNISLSFCYIIVSDNDIEVKTLNPRKENIVYFLEKDFWVDIKDDDNSYRGKDMSKFLGFGLRPKLYPGIPKNKFNKDDPYWLYYFSSERLLNDPKKGIKYCPVDKSCPSKIFLDRKQEHE
jgi:hypothetical protein